MRAIRILKIVLLIFISAPSNSAKIHSRISVEVCANLASHVVIVSVSDNFNGELIVRDSWKGDLKPGQIINIPELKSFKSLESRSIQCPDSILLCGQDGPQQYVTGSRLILFLKKRIAPIKNESGARTGSGPAWDGVDRLSITQTIIWIEGEESFAFFDSDEDKRGILANFGLTEEEIKEKVIAAIQK